MPESRRTEGRPWVSTSVLYTVGQGASCPYANNVSHCDNQEHPPRSWMSLPPEKPRSRPRHSRGSLPPQTQVALSAAARCLERTSFHLRPGIPAGTGNTGRLASPSLRGRGGSFLPLPAGGDGRCPSAPGRTPASASVLTRPIPSMSVSPRLETRWPLPQAGAENPGRPHLVILHVLTSASAFF